MCGIFAYSGTGNAITMVINGLKRLEYRGYDSWGVATSIQDNVDVYKNLGSVSEVIDEELLPPSQEALGHTRWATHGSVDLTNCHPHLSGDKSFAIVHNGIIENFQDLKKELTRGGYSFRSQTDTEVIIGLIEHGIKTANKRSFTEIVRQAFLKLKGRNTLVIFKPQQKQFIAIKNGSPLIIGKSKDNSYFFSSDPQAFAEHTQQVLVLQNGEMVSYNYEMNNNISKPANNAHFILQSTVSGEEKRIQWEKLELSNIVLDKEDYDHYMLKEISEQWATISQAARVPKKQLQDLALCIKKAHKIYVIGAGGAYFTAEQIAYLLRTVANVNALAIPSYEIASHLPLITTSDLVIAISQSGETADTLEAIELCKEKKALCTAIVNAPGSTMARLSDTVITSNAGPEICVLSTKSATAQITLGYVIANYLINNSTYKNQINLISHELCSVFEQGYLNDIKSTAARLKNSNSLYILGRDCFFSTAKISALNIKEASYIHAEAFAAGELKHGVIALIEADTNVILYVDYNDSYMIGVAAELKARGANIIGIAYKNNSLFDEFIAFPSLSHGYDKTISSLIPGQLLAYYLALQKGYNPDRPRNLAKSVTVK